MHSKISYTKKPVDEISEYLLFIVIDGGHFGFYDPQNSANFFLERIVAYSSKKLKQSSNLNIAGG